MCVEEEEEKIRTHVCAWQLNKMNARRQHQYKQASLATMKENIP